MITSPTSLRRLSPRRSSYGTTPLGMAHELALEAG